MPASPRRPRPALPRRIAPALAVLALVAALGLAAGPRAAGLHEASPAAASPAPPAVGALTVRVVDPTVVQPEAAPPAGPPFLPLAGACFAVYPAGDAARRDPVAGACSGKDGVATVRGVPDGDFVLVQTTAPAGYQAMVSPISFAMVYGQTYLMTVENLALGEATFRAVDGAGAALPGACVEVYAAARGQTGAAVARACDADDGAADGATTVRHLAPGEYVAVEVSAPAGYAPAPDQSFTVTGRSGFDFAAERRPLPIAPASTSLTIYPVAARGEPLAGGCYRLVGPADVGPVCDGDASDTAPLPGQVRIDGLAAGEYALQETAAPEGVAMAADQTVAVAEGQSAEVVLLHAAALATAEVSTPAAGGGTTATLVVRAVGGAGEPAPGACVEVMATVPDAGGGFRGRGACDADDGSADGSTTVADLPPGDYIVGRTTGTGGAPVGPAVAVAIGAGETVTLTLVDNGATPAA